jgi:hypothetical protein
VVTGWGARTALSIVIVAGAACATPSRRLSTRQVDDPLMYPKHLMSGAAWVGGTISDEHGKRSGYVIPAGLSFGLTDRITVTLPLVIGVGIMDDVPAGQSPTGIASARSPFGLAIISGITGAGFGGSPRVGNQVNVRLGLAAAKHIGRSFHLDVATQWNGFWRSSQPDRASIYSDLGLMWQLMDHLATRLGVYNRVEMSGFEPSRRWTDSIWGSGPDLRYRPYHWLSLGAGVYVEHTSHPRELAMAVAPFDPSAPALMLDRQPVSVWGHTWVYFYW